MLTKREFLTLYDQTVLGIRQIKNNNDRINKSIGVLNEAALYRETQGERVMVDELFGKVEELMGKMEKNYLDPDTARKIGVVKQQLRIQRDRRQQLLDSVDQITKQYKNKLKQTNKQQQLTTSSPRSKKPHPNRTPSIQMQHNDTSFKRSQMTDLSSSHSSTTFSQPQPQLHLSDYDHQIEHKLLQDRSQQLTTAHAQLLNIKNIVHETSNMVYEQGDKLDIIGEDIFQSYKNVGMANTELEEANQAQRKSRRKYFLFSLFLVVVVAVLLVIIFGM